MNVAQLRDHVIRPVLEHLEDCIPYGRNAEQLVLGTALTESRGEYIRQVSGPALGLWQMEPATHDDIWATYLARPSQRDLARKLEQLQTSAAITLGALEMIGNNYYAAAMCRVFYRRLPDPLPAAGDPLTMAKVWKLRYNTPLGAGTVQKALPYFRTACGV